MAGSVNIQAIAQALASQAGSQAESESEAMTKKIMAASAKEQSEKRRKAADELGVEPDSLEALIGSILTMN